MLTTQEIRQLQAKDLLEELEKIARELMRTKMDLVNGHSKDSHQLKILKNQVARLKTIQRENKQVKATISKK